MAEHPRRNTSIAAMLSRRSEGFTAGDPTAEAGGPNVEAIQAEIAPGGDSFLGIPLEGIARLSRFLGLRDDLNRRRPEQRTKPRAPRPGTRTASTSEQRTTPLNR